MRRARVVLIVTTLALAFVLVAGAVALAEGAPSDRRSEFGIALSRLPEGVPVAVPVTLPGPDAQRSRVAFVRRGDTVSAFLAVDPRFGCALFMPGDADYDRLYDSPRPRATTTFYDNCGGAVYGIDGRCNGGPCRRNLDRYPVRVEAGRATIDVRERRNGRPVLTRRTLAEWCLHENPAAALTGAPPPPNCGT